METAANFGREIYPVPETETQPWRQSPRCVGLCAEVTVPFSDWECGWRCCQTNSNQSPLFADAQISGSDQLAPFEKSDVA